MGRAARFIETLEGRTLRSAAAADLPLTDPGHNLHVIVGQTVNIDPTSPLDADYVTPLSVKWDLNYDAATFDTDATGEQPHVAFDHAGHFIVAGEYVYVDHTELRTFAVDVTDFAAVAPDPLIHVAAPDHAAPGEMVTLTLSSDHAGQTLQFVLDNGDGYAGPAGEPAEITRAFAAPGTYDLKVQLYVDGEYVGYASHRITIGEVAPQVTPATSDFSYVAIPAAPSPLTISRDQLDLLA
jgi:hypothetical protein